MTNRYSLYWVLLLFFSVVIVLFSISSSCFAYSYDQFIEFLELNIDNYTDSDLKGAAQFVLDYKETFKNRFTSLGLDITDYTTWIVYGGGRTSFDNQLIFSNDLNWSCGQNNCINVYNGSSPIKSITFRRYMPSVSSSLATNLNWGLVTQRSSGLITGTNTTGVFYDSTITNQYYNTFGIESDLDDIVYKGYDSYALLVNFMNTYSKIGTINGVSENTHYINVYFGITGNEDPSNITLFNQKNLYSGLNSSDDIYIDDNFNIYVKNRLLYLNNLYTCYVVCYTDSTLSVITNEDDAFFLALKNDAVISGDIVVFFGSGDNYNTQNSTNDILGYLGSYNNPSGDIVGFIGGNIMSGDIINGVKMPKVSRADDAAIFNLINVLGNTLTYSGDAYFDFSLHGETPVRIYASQFRTPDGPLKTFVSSSLVFGTMFMLLLQIRNVMEALMTANIKGAIDYVDLDMNNIYYM